MNKEQFNELQVIDTQNQNKNGKEKYQVKIKKKLKKRCNSVKRAPKEPNNINSFQNFNLKLEQFLNFQKN